MAGKDFPEEATRAPHHILGFWSANLGQVRPWLAQTGQNPLEKGLVGMAKVQGKKPDFPAPPDPIETFPVFTDHFHRTPLAIVGGQGVHLKTVILPQVIVKDLVRRPFHQMNPPPRG